MKKTNLLLITTVTALLHAQEPSVYGAGNLDSARPYGLTQTEQSVLENRREVQLLKNKVTDQQSKIDGMVSIIEGLNQQIMQLREQLESTNSMNSMHADDYNKTYTLLLDLGKIIDQINSTYVTQEDLKAAFQGRDVSTTSPNRSVSDDISSIYTEGVQLFGHKSYNAARVKFEEALAQNYKPAASNYYLGEIAYYTDKYDSAVAYYKKSASLYDKASYMPVLYLHTGIALSRSGQKDQARGFFQFIINTYPNSTSAEIARKNL